MATLLPVTPAPAANFPTKPSPPGQIYVVSANAWQRKVIGVKRFQMMLDLARAVLQRPPAFDGGSERVGSLPDLIVMQEMQPANLEIFANLLRQRSDVNYQIAGSTKAFGKFIINTETIAMQGEAREWNDVCYAAAPRNSEGEQPERFYQWAEFIELESGQRFTASSIHLDPRYTANTGQHNCFERNVPEIKRQMDLTDVPSIIAGDFNRRAVEMTHECDPEETSAPLPWYSMLTAPTTGRVYSDVVRDYHRQLGLSLADEWTHEQKSATVICDTTTRFRRNRIDYMFTAGMETASAHADHPGWAGEEPGTKHPTNPKYSDHRFIAARLKIAGPPRPARPTVTSAKGGLLTATWQPLVDTTPTQWLLYRALGSAPFSLLARLTPETLTYSDFATEHGRRYRYAVAAVDEGLRQGIESQATAAFADSEGPRVKSHTPWANAVGVERRSVIVARFNEPFDPESVHFDTLSLYRKGRRICGGTEIVARRIVELRPCNPLGKKKTYRVQVRSVTDHLGNRGFSYGWTFTTR
ncbi:MAG: Ig-like domain-containing protein [Actinomycetota bacterium]